MRTSKVVDLDRVDQIEFERVRRGFDPEQVRSTLDEISRQIRSLQRDRDRLRSDAQELSAEVERAKLQTEPVMPERHELVKMLGEEMARLLDSARDTADDIRSRAEQDAQAIRDAAAGERTALRAEVEGELAEARNAASAKEEEILAGAERAAAERIAAADADALAMRAEIDAQREQAKEDVKQLLDEAREEGRNMIVEAKQFRERILRDLAGRRKIARKQLEAMQAAQERLLEAFAACANSVESATSELHTALPEAKAAADRAADQVDEDIEQVVASMEAAIATGELPALVLRDLGRPEIRSRALPRRDEVPTGVAAGSSEASSPKALGDVSEFDVLEVPATDADELAPAAPTFAPEPTSETTSTGPLDASIETAPSSDHRGEIDEFTVIDAMAIDSGADVVPSPSDQMDDLEDPDGVRLAADEWDTSDDADREASELLDPSVLTDEDPLVEVAVADGGDAVEADAEPEVAERPRFGVIDGDRVDEPEDELGWDDDWVDTGEFEAIVLDETPVASHLRLIDGEIREGASDPAVTAMVDETAETSEPMAVSHEPARQPEVDDLFARLRAERDEAVATARSALDEVAESIAITNPDDAGRLLARREELTQSSRDHMARKLKRVIDDELNEVLDEMRRSRRNTTAADLFPDSVESVARVLDSVRGELAEAAAQGSVLLAEHGVTPQPIDTHRVADAMGPVVLARVVQSWVDELMVWLDGADFHDAAVVDRVRTAYRIRKLDEAHDLADTLVAAALNAGVVAASSRSVVLEWVSDHGDADPIFHLEGPRSGAVSQVIGDLAAADVRCRCLAVPIDR